MSKVTYIDEVEIKKKTVLLRVDFNVSINLKNRTITDDQRITQALPTINLLLKNKNKLILVSHLGRPDGAPDPKYSMRVVCDRLQEIYPLHKINLIKDFLTENNNAFKYQQDDEILILENIRFYKGEKKNDPDFSKKLAQLADIYVNDAFGVCHRPDASVVGVTKFLKSYGGLLLKKEVEILNHILNKPRRKILSIIGGSKIDSKINLIEKLVEISDNVFVGGALANTLLFSQGIDVKKSLYEKESAETAKEIITKSEKLGKKILLPIDCVVGNKESLDSEEICELSKIPQNKGILDIGPKTIKLLDGVIKKSKTVIWNGPVGYFENESFRKGTDSIFKSIIETPGLISVLGGGDTLSAISKQKNKIFITHISTGGGAMLEYIEKGTLVGIEALKD